MNNSFNIPAAAYKRIVIIGGGFAGINLSKYLRNTNYQVVLLDRNNYHLFQPLLYQVATGGLEPGSIAFPLRKILQGNSNHYFRVAEVNEIDTKNNLIITDKGNVSYDYLVIATGSNTNYFGNNALAQHAMPMKKITEALDIRSNAIQNFEKAVEEKNEEEKNALLNFVIVGGGPTGVELAGAISEMKKYVLPDDYPELNFAHMNIILIEAGDRLIPGMSESSSAKTKKYLENMRVKVMLKCMVNDYDGKTVRFNQTETLLARTLIWAAGVAGESVKGISAEQIMRDKRIRVDEFNKVVGDENVFAIGDVAAMITDKFPKGYPMLAPVAAQQGKHLAKNLKRISKNFSPVPFRYFDKGVMATIGRNKAVAETWKFKLSGWIAWQAWLWVHLLFLIGFRNKLIVLLDWIWNYITYDRAMRLIIRPYNKKDTPS